MTEPVTVGDLCVVESVEADFGNPGDRDYATRPATVADLKSAGRALGWVVIEKVDGEWPGWAIELLVAEDVLFEPGLVIDALAEAQR